MTIVKFEPKNYGVKLVCRNGGSSLHQVCYLGYKGGWGELISMLPIVWKSMVSMLLGMRISQLGCIHHTCISQHNTSSWAFFFFFLNIRILILCMCVCVTHTHIHHCRHHQGQRKQCSVFYLSPLTSHHSSLITTHQSRQPPPPPLPLKNHPNPQTSTNAWQNTPKSTNTTHDM